MYSMSIVYTVYSLEWNVKFIYWKIAFSVNINSADCIVGVGPFLFCDSEWSKTIKRWIMIFETVEQLKNMKNELTVALVFFYFITVNAIHYIVQVLFQYSIFAWFSIEIFQLFFSMELQGEHFKSFELTERKKMDAIRAITSIYYSICYTRYERKSKIVL